MTTFDDAKGKRNWLERLGAAIPGYRGFQDRELRRDVDKALREHLAAELGRVKSQAREKARSFTDAGKIGALQLFERLDKKLDGLSQAMRFTDYGATGLFDAVKVGETELSKVYELDAALLDDLHQLASDIAAVPGASDDPTAALQAALDHLQALETKWAGRRAVLTGAAQG